MTDYKSHVEPRDVTGVFDMEIAPGTVIQIEVTVAGSDVVVQPPRPKPKARMIALLPLETGVRAFSVSVYGPGSG